MFLRPVRSPSRVRALAAAALVATALAAHPASAGEETSPRPGTPWTPPPDVIAPPRAAAASAPPPSFAGSAITLAEAVDFALQTSPVTRRAWLVARSAAADVGSKKGPLWPQLELDANLLRQKQAALGGSVQFLQTTWSPSAVLSWILFDFGGRTAEVEAARRTLFAADFLQNAAISDVVLQVQLAYYQYQGAKALLAATEASLAQAQENLTAAEERRRAGVATVADVLQAKTSVSQRRLEVETTRGLIETTRGALATSLGVSASVPVDVAELPDGLRLEGATPSVEELIERAASERPDLAAARERAAAQWSKVRSARAAGLPVLSTGATAARVYYESGGAAADFADTWSAGLFLRWPVFTGFQKSSELRKAKEDAAAADAFTESLAQQVGLSVWSGYYGVTTAAQRIRAAKDLLASAAESEDVTRARYRAGVGSILDLLSAETALASARATDVQARASFLVALAQLAHDTGILGLPSIPQLKKDTP